MQIDKVRQADKMADIRTGRQTDRRRYVRYIYLHAPFRQPEAAWTNSATTGTGEPPCSCDVVCGLRIRKACSRKEEEEEEVIYLEFYTCEAQFLTRWECQSA